MTQRKTFSDISIFQRDAFLQFYRNGRWGTCVACPRDSDEHAYPEFCEYTKRYDHHLGIDELGERFMQIVKDLAMLNRGEE